MPAPLAQVLSIVLPILVVGHRNPDTDSIASALAMADLERQQGRAALAIAQGPPTPRQPMCCSAARCRRHR